MAGNLEQEPASAASGDHFASLDYYQQMLLNRLGWLIELRWIGVLGLVVGLIYTRLVSDDYFEIYSYLFFALFIQSYNLVFTLVDYWLHNKGKPTPAKNIAFALTQIFFDLVTLTVAIHQTGGVNSVFVICYVFHMIIAGALLRRWVCVIVAAITCVMFDAVVFLEAQGVFPHRPIQGFTLGYLDQAYTPPAPDVVFHLCLLFNSIFFIVIIIASSIGEQLRHRERLIEEYNRDLRRTNKAKSDFMRMASHEMRTPLSAIQGMLEMLYKRINKSDEPDEISRDLIGRSVCRTRSLFDLINDLLHYSRLQTITTADYRQEFNLSVIIARAIEDLMPIAEQKKIHMQSSLKTAWIDADKEQILMLVKNIIGNALRYTPYAGDIEISLTRKTNKCIMRFTDNGIGIDAASLPYIFEEFFRAPDAKEYEAGGTGLGLTMCKRIVDNHKGTIHASSVPNQCTVFTVELPLAKNYQVERKKYARKNKNGR